MFPPILGLTHGRTLAICARRSIVGPIGTILMEASMSIAMTVDKYLRQLQVPYDILAHYRTGSSLETARVAHISAHQLAKADRAAAVRVGRFPFRV